MNIPEGYQAIAMDERCKLGDKLASECGIRNAMPSDTGLTAKYHIEHGERVYRKIAVPSHLDKPKMLEQMERASQEERLKSMPSSAAERKGLPLVTGVLDYFPDALLAVAHCSKVGNEQHSPGQPLHWDRSKSTDQADALGRHLLQRGTIDTDGVRHSAKLAWRVLALLQLEIEGDRK